MRVLGFRKRSRVVFFIVSALLIASCTAQQVAPPDKPSPKQAGEPAKSAEAPKPATKASEVKVAIPTKSLNVLPLYLGVEAGIFKQDGLDVKIVIMPATPTVAALVAGDIDFSTVAGAALRSAAAGMPVKAIAFTVNKPSWDFMAKKEIATVKDLKGKIVGITTRAAGVEYVTRDILKFYGVDSDKDVTLLPTGSAANSLAALVGGSIDAALLSPPDSGTAKKAGFIRVDYDQNLVREQVLTGLATSDKKLKESPDGVKTMVKGLLKTIRYTIDNKPAAVKLIAKEWELEPEVAESSYDSFVKTYSRNGTIGEATVKEELERIKQEATIKDDVPLSKVMDLSALNDALKEVGRLEEK